MKKLTFFILVTLFFASKSFAVSEWDVTEIAGSRNASDIDAYSIVNAQAQDRLLIGYRRGMGVNYSSASALSVLTGEIAIPNAAGTVTRYRRLTTTNAPGWAQIDTGAEANSTTYYLYAVGDTDSTEPTFSISASSSAPSGKTYYVKIAQFYNDASGNITNVISYRPDYGADYPDVVKGWVNFTGTGTVTINDQHNVSSITDNGTGDYTINWSTAFSSAYYAISGNAAIGNFVNISSITSSSSRILVYDYNGLQVDSATITLIATGDRI